MLTEAQLKAAAKEHFAAEEARDVEWIGRTVAENVEYIVLEPGYSDDPLRAPGAAEGNTTGRQAVKDLWTNYYEIFHNHRILCRDEDMYVIPDRNLVFCNVRITATPTQDFEGFPANKEFSYTVGALCAYNDEGKMTRETVYGSMGRVLMGLRRMREWASESAH